MSAPRSIPDAIRQRQTEASDPDVSAFVSANAGSGKTHVLAQRAIRLLLNGTDPSKILCLTFTKAAAANMATRVFDTLRRWTALDDGQLADAIRAIGVADPGPATMTRARRLFAEAIETPGGLKVQTIHAFCTRLLHQFPFEANVAARFAVLDERAELELLERESLAVLLEAAAAPDSALGRALGTVIAGAADTTIRDLINEAIRKRDTVMRWIEQTGGLDGAAASLSNILAINPDDTPESIDAEIIDGPLFPAAEWLRAADICASGSKRDNEQCERLRAAAAATGAQRVELYLDVFFTQAREPRASLLTKTLWETQPDLAGRLTREQSRLITQIERRRAAATRERTMALLTIVHAAIARYRTEKDRRGLLDYNDLIAKTLGLLDPKAMSWVHYKLDYGIDHVLIDEAQDTSPDQWEIIRRLVSEFAAGAGARARIKRTVFAVGDEKQSIFSFQGAAPHEFDTMRKEFAKVFDRPQFGWRHVQFDYSFRSGASVLAAVDNVFQARTIYASITSDVAGVLRHESLPDAAPGRVEIWELETPDDAHEPEGWDAPFDSVSVSDPQVRLAQRIARRAKAMIAGGVAAGNILVLVRQRGPLFEAIIRALKFAGVDVAGADRLKLTEHIAVEDLMTLGDALLLPQDDLALAVALKSPLFGFDEDALYELAWNRPGTLREALAARHPELATQIDRLAALARSETPFTFYAHLFGPQGARARILARLGMEAADALDEFLNLALAYESRATPTLQGFLVWLRAAQTEIKRDMDIARNEVRVMTVHGAKGLEAPVVFLADTTTRPEGPRAPRLLALPRPDAPPGAASALVWAGAKKNDGPAVSGTRTTALTEAENEYRRLLYVAMTRAAQHLIVCGYEGKRARPDLCWYNLVRNALQGELVGETAADGDILVFQKPGSGVATGAGARSTPSPQDVVSLPDWLRRPMPGEASHSIAIAPSQAEEETADATDNFASGRSAARARGIALHRLLQALPGIPRAEGARAADTYLERPATKLDEAGRIQVRAQVFAILDDPQFAPLFGEGSRAEVPIAGTIARAGEPALRIGGQVDRLCITDREVLIADYKSNRPAPKTVAEAIARHPAYIRQLALYRAVLRLVFPQHAFRAALIWTDSAEMMEIPVAALDAQMAILTSA